MCYCVTRTHFLERVTAQAGHVVLIHSAAGGCGQAALKICAAVGATAVATVGSQSKADYLLQRYPGILMPDAVIVRDSAKFAGQLRTVLASLNSTGFDIVLDAVSGEYFQPGASALQSLISISEETAVAECP